MRGVLRGWGGGGGGGWGGGRGWLVTRLLFLRAWCVTVGGGGGRGWLGNVDMRTAASSNSSGSSTALMGAIELVSSSCEVRGQGGG